MVDFFQMGEVLFSVIGQTHDGKLIWVLCLFQILLRGANGDELKKVKHVVQYGIFAAYHLALETSFLADEGASLPELPFNTPITVALPDKPSGIDRSISTIPGVSLSLPVKKLKDLNHVGSHKDSTVSRLHIWSLPSPVVPFAKRMQHCQLVYPLKAQNPLQASSTPQFPCPFFLLQGKALQSLATMSPLLILTLRRELQWFLNSIHRQELLQPPVAKIP